MLSSAGNILLLAFGFGFVIFWHELGHFLAAKWADVKVEQFAVGFGQALFSWRKGLGFRFGTSAPEYEQMLQAEREGIQQANLSGISETEYRLNWIPLGGYVKMLGQDDMKPGEQVADPRSYTAKPVGKRMVIVSAGVIMNVILAAIGFMVLFKVGYKVPKPTVGQVVPGAPAMQTVRASDGKPDPIRPGDTILKVNGRWQVDFDKIRLNTPLLIPEEPVTIDVVRAGTDRVDHLIIKPRRATPDSEFPQLGIAPAHDLRGIDPALVKEVPAADLKQDPKLQPDELFLFHPGDTITTVAGKPVTPEQGYVLTDALQAGAGRPVAVTVKAIDGHERTVRVPAHFVDRFGVDAIDFGGLQMLSQVFVVQGSSPLATTKERAGVLPGDVIVNVADSGASGGQRPMPTSEELDKFVREAADGGSKLSVTVLRDGKSVTLPAIELDKKAHGLGLQLATWEAEPVIAHPPAGSAADEQHIPGGARLTKVDGHPVANWFDVYTAMCAIGVDRPIAIEASVDGKDQSYTLRGLTAAELDVVRQNRIDSYAVDGLMPATWVRKADNAVQAAQWGVGETRDAILQVYMTVRAMFKGSIPLREFSGPLGILAVGYKLAEQGSTRLLWFLSIISANLAVMNFLPIPVVDGGLFTFLIIEKLKGSPISQRTQVYAQYVGLALLLSVFLFATWQDLFRIPQLFH